MRHLKSLVVWAAVGMLLLSSCSAHAPTPSALPTITPVPTPVPDTLFVDGAQDLGSISPFVYGANYGPWVGVLPELLQVLARAAHAVSQPRQLRAERPHAFLPIGHGRLEAPGFGGPADAPQGD